MGIYIPNELIILILSFINETQTYLNARLVCKLWYDILCNVKHYNNNKLINISTFNNDYFETRTLNNILVKKIIFHQYGRYTYMEYDSNGLSKEIKCKPPFTIQSIEYNPFSKSTKSYNIIQEKLTSNIVNYMPFNCTIS